MLRKTCLLILIIVLLLLGQTSWAGVRNVVLMIGDGMGFEQVKAASLYAYGREGRLSFEKFYRGEMMTHSANSYLQKSHATDSAAAVTAMATGQKVDNRILSQKGDEPIKTILEYLQQEGKTTGLVTTVPVTHATPAGFGAHTKNRNNYEEIADDYLNQTRPNVLFGAFYANGRGMTETKAKQAGYLVAQTREQMHHIVWSVDQNPTKEVFIVGLFSPDEMPWEYDYYNPHRILFPEEKKSDSPDYNAVPHLSEMTTAALSLLGNDPDGFFLMVEGGKIDWACHGNIIEHCVFNTLEFDKAFQVVLNWAEDQDDTLILVTADHECGGLRVVKNRGKGFMPQVFWGSTDHTGANVPVYATGQGAEEFVGVIDNTELFTIILELSK